MQSQVTNTRELQVDSRVALLQVAGVRTFTDPFTYPSSFMSQLVPSESKEARLEVSEGVCVLSYESLNVDKITKSVGDDSAGATVVFIGTTRNSFKGASLHS